MVPCMEPVKHVAALGSKLLQAGGAAAPASGGAVAHEAGEHASIVVDYKLHVTTRANVSKQPADLRAGLSASTSRQMSRGFLEVPSKRTPPKHRHQHKHLSGVVAVARLYNHAGISY